MPIQFECTCGAPLTAPDEMAGMNLICSACDEVLIVPDAGLSLAKPQSSPQASMRSRKRRMQATPGDFSEPAYWIRRRFFSHRYIVLDSERRKLFEVAKRRRGGFCSRLCDIEFRRLDQKSPFMRLSKTHAGLCSRHFKVKNRDGTVGRIEIQIRAFTGYFVYVHMYKRLAARFETERARISCFGCLLTLMLAPVIVVIAQFALAFAMIAAVVVVPILVIGYILGMVPLPMQQFVYRAEVYATLGSVFLRGNRLKRNADAGDLEVCLIISVLRLYRELRAVPFELFEDSVFPQRPDVRPPNIPPEMRV